MPWENKATPVRSLNCSFDIFGASWWLSGQKDFKATLLEGEPNPTQAILVVLLRGNGRHVSWKRPSVFTLHLLAFLNARKKIPPRDRPKA